ncbi:hypothetical protein BJ742DRAFT_792158 [Cladochytrium replicatum]|nr:hypothetical protein BJ742DRAFT_792158 [Cladochytrium replicatum]
MGFIVDAVNTIVPNPLRLDAKGKTPMYRIEEELDAAALAGNKVRDIIKFAIRGQKYGQGSYMEMEHEQRLDQDDLPRMSEWVVEVKEPSSSRATTEGPFLSVYRRSAVDNDLESHLYFYTPTPSPKQSDLSKVVSFAATEAATITSDSAHALSLIFRVFVLKPTDFVCHSTIGVSPFDFFRPWTVGNPTLPFPRPEFQHSNPDWFDVPPPAEEYIFRRCTTKKQISTQTDDLSGDMDSKWSGIVKDTAGDSACAGEVCVKEAGTTREPYYLKKFGDWFDTRMEAAGTQTDVSISRWYDARGALKEAPKIWWGKAKDVTKKFSGTPVAGGLLYGLTLAATMLGAREKFDTLEEVVRERLDLAPIREQTNDEKVIVAREYNPLRKTKAKPVQRNLEEGTDGLAESQRTTDNESLVEAINKEEVHDLSCLASETPVSVGQETVQSESPMKHWTATGSSMPASSASEETLFDSERRD